MAILIMIMIMAIILILLIITISITLSVILTTMSPTLIIMIPKWVQDLLIFLVLDDQGPLILLFIIFLLYRYPLPAFSLSFLTPFPHPKAKTFDITFIQH